MSTKSAVEFHRRLARDGDLMTRYRAPVEGLSTDGVSQGLSELAGELPYELTGDAALERAAKDMEVSIAKGDGGELSDGDQASIAGGSGPADVISNELANSREVLKQTVGLMLETVRRRL